MADPFGAGGPLGVGVFSLPPMRETMNNEVLTDVDVPVRSSSADEKDLL
jgi:hypothetical protein